MTKIRMAEISLQFSDSPQQIEHDVQIIFCRDYQFIFGTEAGPFGKIRDIVKKWADKTGYRVQFGRADSWVAVQKTFIKGKWEAGYTKVIDRDEGVGAHGNKGIVWVKFKSELGRTFLLGAGHYLTKGRRAGEPNFALNKRFGTELRTWASQHGQGCVVIYGGDQNIVDEHNDTFFGAPFTSAWDELKKWEGTGHGNIDVIASWDRSRGIEWVHINAIRDRRLRLHTDHFLVEAVANVVNAKHKGTPTARVVKNLKGRGRRVYGHKTCLIFSSVYKNRRKTHPHHIIWNGDHDPRDDRVDTLWAHISVTRAVGIGIRSCMRTLHTIGMQRFGSGISYNFAIHHRTGQIGVGQFLDAKGTHTVMRVPRAGYSTDQNAVSVAIVFIGMPGMVVSQKAWESYEHLIAALIEEGFLTTHFDHNPHSFADPDKDCPTDVVRNMLPELKAGGLRKVR